MEEIQYMLQEIRRMELAGRSGQAYGEFADTHTLLIALHGSGELYVNGTKHRLKAKSLSYCPPGAIIELRQPDGAAPLELFELKYELWELEMQSVERAVLVKQLAAHLDSGELPWTVSHEAIALLEQLCGLWQTGEGGRRSGVSVGGEAARPGGTDPARIFAEPGGPGERLLVAAIFKQALHELLRAPRIREPGDEWASRIWQVAAYVDKHYAQPITRSEMAKRAGLTPEHFSVSFKRVTGLGFSQYLARLRIEQVKEALLGEDCNLDRLARDVGYRDGMYLSRKFKQVTGVSPRDYARRPKRIVALQYLGHLLALGLAPAGTTDKLLNALPYRGLLGEVASIGDGRSLQAIARLSPDLIITSRPNREPLARLATTISLPWGREDCLEELRMLGRALNRTAEAEAWIAAFTQKAALASAQVAQVVERGATAAVFEFWPDKLWAANIGYGRGLRNIYQTFCFHPPKLLAPHVLNEGLGLQLDMAQIADYAADYIFVSIWKEGGGEEHARRAMASNAWRSLPAVQNGRVYLIDLELFKHNDPIALELQLAIQTELLTKVHKNPHIQQ